jgi:outer membrane protein
MYVAKTDSNHSKCITWLFSHFGKCCTAFALVLVLGIANAKTLSASIEAKPLTLIDLTDIALSQNPATRIAWAEVKSAAASVGIAKSAYWPTLNADLIVNYYANRDSESNNTIIDIGVIENTTPTTLNAKAMSSGNPSAASQKNSSTKSVSSISYNPSLSLNYLLLDFGNRAQTLKAARYQFAAAIFNQNAAIQQVILQVEQAYYQLIGQQELVKANLLDLKQNQANLNAAEALHKQGLVTIGDVYQARSALTQTQLTLQEADGLLATYNGQLASSIGLPVQTALKLAQIPQNIETKPIKKTVEQLLATAKQQRPDLLSYEAQINAAQAQLKATESQAWPTVGLSADSGRTYPLNAFNQNQTNILLTVNFPIFTGFLQTYNERKARAQRELVIAERDQLSNQIALEVWQAYYTLQTAAKAVQSSEELLTNSTQAAQQTYGQYRAGVGNILSVLATQSTQASARVQHIRAKLTWFISLSQLAAAIGTLNQAQPPGGL